MCFQVHRRWAASSARADAQAIQPSRYKHNTHSTHSTTQHPAGYQTHWRRNNPRNIQIIAVMKRNHRFLGWCLSFFSFAGLAGFNWFPFCHIFISFSILILILLIQIYGYEAHTQTNCPFSELPLPDWDNSVSVFFFFWCNSVFSNFWSSSSFLWIPLITTVYEYKLWMFDITTHMIGKLIN